MYQTEVTRADAFDIRPRDECMFVLKEPLHLLLIENDGASHCSHSRGNIFVIQNLANIGNEALK